MRHVAMAFRTAALLFLPSVPAHLAHLVLVTTLAIAQYRGYSPVRQLQNLRFPSHGEHRGMPKTIKSFMNVVIECSVLRKVAIRTGSVGGVGTTLPCAIGRAHDVTVGACLRGVIQVRLRPRNLGCNQR